MFHRSGSGPGITAAAVRQAGQKRQPGRKGPQGRPEGAARTAGACATRTTGTARPRTRRSLQKSCIHVPWGAFPRE